MTEAEFEAFYLSLAPRLRRYLGRLCPSGSVAEDLVQEAFFRFLRSGFSGGEEERRRYLFTIATNLARNQWSRTRKEEMVSPPPLQKSGTVERMDLMRALMKLRPRERAMLWLAYAEGYDQREIAEIMGVARAGVRVLLFRARRKLRNLMEDQP